MNVYISVDMEGVAGVAHEDQTDPVNPAHAVEYARFRRLMTDEANAAIQGAASAGASRILVNDSHWLMRNLLAEELHEAAELISSGPKRLSMMEGVDGGFDAVHVHRVSCDGRHTARHHRSHLYRQDPPGEAERPPGGRAGTQRRGGGMLRRAGGDGVGRPGTRRRRREHCWEPDIETVVVKEAVGRFSARSVSPAESCRRIRAGATRALQRKHAPFAPGSPVTLEVEFALTQHADNAELVPGSERRDGRTLSYMHADYREVFRAFRAMYNLAAVA